MEKELGVPLFEKNGRNTMLTPFGREFLSCAEHTLSTLDDGIASLQRSARGSGLIRLGFVSATYFLCGLMDVMVGSIRGLGYSIMPMLVSLTGACLFRVIWIFTIFQLDRTLECLYISYPISWVLTLSLIHI